jgi:magnesium transporter
MATKGSGGMRAQWTRDGSVETGDRWPENSRFLWVDLDAATPHQVQAVVHDLFVPHPLALSRLMERKPPEPGLQVYPDVMAFTLVSALGQHDASPLHVVLGERFLLTVHRTANPMVDRIWRISQRRHVLTRGPDLVLYMILRRHLRQYQARRTELVREYERIHVLLLNEPYRDLAHAILKSRQQFLKLRRQLGPEVPAFNLLGSDDFRLVRDDNRPYLQDLASAMRDMVEEVDATREGLSGTVEAYTSMQSNEINKVMKFLTIISVLSLPATTIASIYGMNFNMPELHWKYGYPYSLSLMAAITGSLLWYMRRHGWFR